MTRVRIRPGDHVDRKGTRTVVVRVRGGVVSGYQCRADGGRCRLVPFSCDADGWLWFTGNGRRPVTPRPSRG